MHPQRRYVLRGWLSDLLGSLLVALVIVLGVNAVSGRFHVEGNSMMPTLAPGQFMVISKAAYWFHKPQRGDIVVMRPLDGGQIPYIKRIIGLPGERVTIRNGRVYINGIVLNEPYVSGPPMYQGEWIVGEDEYFLLGDNRNQSSDSHVWGVLPRRNIQGKAVMVYWPLPQMRVLTYTQYPELMAFEHGQ